MASLSFHPRHGLLAAPPDIILRWRTGDDTAAWSGCPTTRNIFAAPRRHPSHKQSGRLPHLMFEPGV